MSPQDFSLEINRLLESEEPAIRFKTKVHVLGENPDSEPIVKLRRQVQKSRLVTLLFSNRDARGHFRSDQGIYAKWQGAHWILATLADIGYPANDPQLHQAREEVLDYWLAPRFFKDYVAEKKADAYKKDGIPVMQGRHRTCASQQGYALYYLIHLGLEDERVHQLAERLIHWQWPDGGWNCDKEPGAKTSTFIHTAIALRGLSLYNQRYGTLSTRKAVDAAVEFLLQRSLFRRLSTGTIVHPEFTVLHYPLYWHYDILGALKIMAEAGRIRDPRCLEALELVLAKRLTGGGWAAEGKYYRTSNEHKLGNDYIDWGGVSKKAMNEWVTVDVLTVLKRSQCLEAA